MGFVIIAVISIALFVLSVRQEKRRPANIGLFFLACGAAACSLEWLSGSGWAYTYLLSYLFLLFSLASIVFSFVCLVAAKELYDKRRSRKIAGFYVIAGIFAWVLIAFFHYTLGGPFFVGVWDACLHLILMISAYFVLSFGGLVIYTFLSHIMPSRNKWDYILIVDTLTPDGILTTRLRRRLEIVHAVCRNIRGKVPRIILPTPEAAYAAQDYLGERGIDAEHITYLDTVSTALRARLAAVADAPPAVKPYHFGLIITVDYLVCRTAHELKSLGLHGEVLGYQTSLGRWAVQILNEYQNMLWINKRALIIVAVCWLILCTLSLWW
jgi:hypothetical protein